MPKHHHHEGSSSSAPTATTTFVAAQAAEATLPSGKEKWSSNIWGCFGDCDSCLVSFTLPCLQHGLTRERFNGAPWPASMVLSGVGYGLYFCGLYACVPCMWRAEIREKYNIKGSRLEDFFAHCCCPCCATAQEARELDKQTGYVKSGMAMPKALWMVAEQPLLKADALAKEYEEKATLQLAVQVPAAGQALPTFVEGAQNPTPPVPTVTAKPGLFTAFH
uniref:Uncharacterized protein n=1 Tax=Cyanoptyche gloeocystis TaxID=77922 RepID=A0A7S2JNA3_9EUKA